MVQESKEAKILENIHFLHREGDRARMSCDIVVILPVSKDIFKNEYGTVRGFFKGNPKDTFMLRYEKSENVAFHANGERNGTLKIGNDNYHVEGLGDKPIIYVEKRFSDYLKLWQYIGTL